MAGPARLAALPVLVATAFFIGCGKDSGTGPKHVGPPASLTIVSGDQQQAAVGTELPKPLVAKVVDANGNAIQGQAVNFRVTAGGGSVFAGTSISNADGIAQERWTLGTVAGMDQTVEARAVDNTTGQPLVFATFHATAVAGPPTRLTLLTQPSAGARSGRVLDTVPVVRLTDQYGNAVHQSGVSVAATLSTDHSGRAVSAGGTANTDANGVATFTGLTITGGLGSVTLTFTAANLTSVAANPITLGAGTPTQLNAVGPTTFTGPAGAQLTTLPKVLVQDAAGNPVQGVAVQFAVSNGGGTIAPTSVLTDVNGMAAISSWILPATVGTYPLVASISELPNSSVTFSATVQAGAAAHLVIVTGNNSTATVDTDAPPLVVKVTDASGNPVSAAQVNWSVTSGGGTLRTTATSTAADGTAVDTLRVGTTTGSPDVVTAEISNLSVQFTVTPTASVAANISKKAGDNQTQSAGAAVSVAPSVLVTDRYGNPVPNVTVTFAIGSGGGTIAGATQATNGEGVATAGQWKLGSVSGVTNTLTATVSNSVTVTFTATSTNPLTIGITSPTSNQNSSATLTIVAHVASTVTPAQIATVTATVDGRQTTLSPGQTSGDWTGTLSLQGLTTGQKLLAVTATDAYGNSKSVSGTFFFNDAPPTLTVDSPTDGAIYAAAQAVPLRASCKDDSPHCIVSVARRNSSVQGGYYYTDVAKADGTLDLSYPVSQEEGTQVEFLFTATDSYGHTLSQKRSVFVESSTRLTATYTVPGTILDAGGDRLLYLNGAMGDTVGQLAIRHRLDGSDEILSFPGHLRDYSYLTPTGAIVNARTTTLELLDWRNGSTTDLGKGGLLSASADNPYAVYASANNSLVLRDEIQGVSTVVHTPSGMPSVPLTSGEFLYAAVANASMYSTRPVYRYSNGTSTLFTVDTACHRNPAYDGRFAVYAIDHCGPYGDPQALVLNDGGTETVLLAPASYQSFQYFVKNGWVVYGQSTDPTGSQTASGVVTHIWSRTPTGYTIDLGTVNEPSVTFESLGPAGQLVYRSFRGRFVAVPSGGSYTTTNIGNGLGAPFWIKDQLFIGIGGTLLQVNY